MPCGCLGCGDDAVFVIDHPDHGRRVVCEDHADQFRVLGFVEGRGQ